MADESVETVRFGVFCVALGVVFLFGRAGGNPEPDAKAAAVRELLVPSCGTCHRSSLPSAKPAALRVFNLDEPDWDWKMTNEQVEELARRLRASEKLSPADTAELDDYLKHRLGATRR